MKQRLILTASFMFAAFVVCGQAHSSSLLGDVIRNGARQAAQERQAKQATPQRPVPAVARQGTKAPRPPSILIPEFDLGEHQACGSALGYTGSSLDALKPSRDRFKQRNDQVITMGSNAARLALLHKDRTNAEQALELTAQERAVNEAVDSDMNRMILHGSLAGINFVTQKKQRILAAQDNAPMRQVARRNLVNIDIQEAELVSGMGKPDEVLAAYDQARASYEAAVVETLSSVETDEASLDRFLMIERDYTILTSCRKANGQGSQSLSESALVRKAAQLSPVLVTRLEKAKTVSTTARQYSQAIAPYKYSPLLANWTPQTAAVLSKTAVTLATLEASDLRLEQQRLNRKRLAREAQARAHAASMLVKGPDSTDAQTALATAWMESFSGYAILPSAYSVDGPTMTANAGLLQMDTFSVTDMRCTKAGAQSFSCSYRLAARRSVELGPFALANAQIFSVGREDQFVLSGGAWQVETVKPFYKGVLASIAGTGSTNYGDSMDPTMKQWNDNMQTQRNTQEWANVIQHGF